MILGGRNGPGDMMKASILRNLFLSFNGFGLLMGIVFPFYAQFFVEWKPGMQMWFAVGCLVAGVSIGLLNYLLVKLVLLKKMHRLSDIANAISENDFSKTCSINSADVIGRIVDSVNTMVKNLRGMAGSIGRSSGRLNNTVMQIETLVENTNHAMLNQREETEHVAHAMQEMQDVSNRVASMAMQASEASVAVNEQADLAQQQMSRNIEGTNTLAEEVREASEVVQGLRADSADINKVLDVITSIAENTNLLALNAAIEAARAGEQGRGFAVVADEVRVLATRTQESTREIRETIERLHEGVRRAVDVMDRGTEKANVSMQDATEASQALTAMRHTLNTITEMSQDISDNTRTQNTMATDVNNSIRNVEAASEATSEMATELTDMSSQLAGVNAELDAVVRNFNF